MVALQIEFQQNSTPGSKSRSNAEIRISRRRVTGKQLRFDWDANDTSESLVENSNSRSSVAVEPKPASPTNLSKPAVTPARSQSPSANQASRIGEPTKLGLVMFRLLKRYGITDEEIIEGLQMSQAQAV